jgi:RHS repeat-associated protein
MAQDAPSGTAPADTTATDATAPDAGASASSSLPTDDEPNLPDVAGASGDILNFQTDLFTGRFTYRVPILLPPARAGSTPSLGLMYSSSGGNGWCGVGWLLDMGFIQRDTSAGVPRAWNGTLPANSYDDSKGFIFVLGGVSSRLVLVNSATKEYRAAVESGAFLKFIYDSTNNKWTVTDKAGNNFYFGEATASRMENTKFPAGAAASTFRWALDQTTDVNGNQTTLSYQTYSNQLYLAQIDYNQNINGAGVAKQYSVKFNLETAERPDRTITFLPGYRVETRKRLGDIAVYLYGSSTLIRRYVLSYTISPSTYRSVLTTITQKGSDDSSTLPPLKFSYQVKPFTFDSLVDWANVNSQSNSGTGWNSIRSFDSSDFGQTEFVDIDGDGFPDRVMRQDVIDAQHPVTKFSVQRNTGTNFYAGVLDYNWNGVTNSESTKMTKTGSPRAKDSTTYIYSVELLDLDGDNRPDRVLRAPSSPYTYFWVQFNLGTNALGYSAPFSWGPVTNESGTGANDWRAPRAGQSQYAALTDINGDGLPDHVTRKMNSQYTNWWAQINNGTGFNNPVNWGPVDSQSQPGDPDWNKITYVNANNDTAVAFVDINGDGLPDRVMRSVNSPYSNFYVQFNNGAGFEPDETWGTIDNQGQSGTGWSSPMANNSGDYVCTLADINGDGLPDRIMRNANSPYDRFQVQLNTGSGFTNLVAWTPLQSEAGTLNSSYNCPAAKANGDYFVDLVDINGDGLLDRVMRKQNTPYDRFKVQLNSGPFPDLMSTVDNGIGGKVNVSYTPSTKYDNHDRPWSNDPWAAGALSTMPFAVYTVSTIVTFDGFDPINGDTNTYSYAGGVFVRRECRGFNRVTVTDGRGTKRVTHFHQGAGTNDAVNGEWSDTNSFAKVGMPYRTELIGNDGLTNSIALSKVEEVAVSTNGWYFAFVSRAIKMDYEGQSGYRATAKDFSYDATGNLTNTMDWGEVSVSSVANYNIGTPGPSAVYTKLTYNSQSKPTDIIVSGNSNFSPKLRETMMNYDSRGNPTAVLRWLDTCNCYTTNSIGYDVYGNPTSTVNPVGITTTISYDTSTQTFPGKQITGGFTNSVVFDVRSGAALSSTNAAGLVAATTFDVFFRPTETDISTNAFGATVLWKAKASYNLGGVGNSISTNYVHRQVNDATDANGLESYTYFDGRGRVAQVRAESETANQYRVSDTFYDERGNVEFVTLPYFSNGTNFTTGGTAQLGTLTEYDAVGRAFRVTSPATSAGSAAGDTCSPVGSTTTAYVDGSNPWAVVVTDPENKSRKAFHDAFGRVTNIVEVTSGGNFNTYYTYNKVGDLTQVKDNAGNLTTMNYDSLGTKTNMIDPDMGTWWYQYDAARRMTQQIDAKGQKLTFTYSDPIGRLTSKQIYDSGGMLVATISYTYDVSDDPSNFTVFKGQLYKVSDREGNQRNSYDVRGRVVKTQRYLTVNAGTYTTQSTYDDADRIKKIIYPNSAATVQYSYDTGANLTKVESLCGTGVGSNEVFYTANGFTALGQVGSITFGNGVTTTYTYGPNSKRMTGISTVKGMTTLQNLTYCYNKVSNLGSITDSAYPSGTISNNTLTGISYDDLHRLTGYTRNSTNFVFAYDSIGNITVNPEFGAGSYTYPAAGSPRPHAVTAANGKTYSYDACGNMTNRNGQVLSYDQENQLKQLTGTNTVTFGYADGGQRLWRQGGTLDIFIGGIYELRGTKVLCHVFAGGRRICTFEPAGQVCTWLDRHPDLARAYYFCAAAKDWPLQGGRTPLTVALIPLLGVLGVLVVSRRKASHESTRIRTNSRFIRVHWWLQSVSVLLVVVLFVAITPTAEAVTYTPVFYYYHPDHLGSANILTDRQGNLVQHYENAAFGKQRYQDNTSAFNVSNRYTDQILDEDTGLYYYNARYYDPELGRFILADSIVSSAADSQSLNRYSYVRNNPINSVDPSGRSGISRTDPPPHPGGNYTRPNGEVMLRYLDDGGLDAGSWIAYWNSVIFNIEGSRSSYGLSGFGVTASQLAWINNFNTVSSWIQFGAQLGPPVSLTQIFGVGYYAGSAASYFAQNTSVPQGTVTVGPLRDVTPIVGECGANLAGLWTSTPSLSNTGATTFAASTGQSSGIDEIFNEWFGLIGVEGKLGPWRAEGLGLVGYDYSNSSWYGGGLLAGGRAWGQATGMAGYEWTTQESGRIFLVDMHLPTEGYGGGGGYYNAPGSSGAYGYFSIQFTLPYVGEVEGFIGTGGGHHN